MDSAARAGVRVDPRAAAASTSTRSARAGRVRRQSPEPLRRARSILAALPGHIRKTVAPAMAKEFFKAHFFPGGRAVAARSSLKRLNYYLAAFFFNAFPLPQREAGARQTLRYIGEVTGDGFSVLIFPEGVRSETGEMTTFRGGIGMIASRLDAARRAGPPRRRAPASCTSKSKMAAPGRVTVTFGAPMRLKGDDYAALARRSRTRCERCDAAPAAHALERAPAEPRGPRGRAVARAANARARSLRTIPRAPECRALCGIMVA